IAFQIWFISYIATCLYLCASFTYRYGLLCSRYGNWPFGSYHSNVICKQVIQAILIWWMYISNYFLFVESLVWMQYNISNEYGINLINSYVLTADIKTESIAWRCITGSVLIMAILQLQIAIIVYCGWNIHATLKVRAMSDKAKEIHRKALKMMISQV
ncbi:hypothetical protein PMAYCL1PPCAC_26760, partial [Pristionchus mayeri]